MPLIETRSLTKFYGKNRGIEALTLAVDLGATYGFLGPNGAGKTTTIRCLLGMLKPTAGEAHLFGERVTLDGSALRRRIGYVAGDVRLYDRETGSWHIDYVSRLRGAPARSLGDLVERLGFDASRRVRELSKGNRQKLALILGLMHDPELLILDEPTSGLDPLNQEVVFDIVRERVRDGATLFLSSHILSEVEKVCSRIGIIRDGALVAEEDVADLLAKRVRRVEVRFTEAAEPAAVAGLAGVGDVHALDARTLTFTAKGDVVDALVKRLATYDLADVRIQHANLEEVFLEYYTGGAASPAAEGGEDR